MCLLFIMVEAKKSDSVNRGGLDEIKDSSRSYTASVEEMSGHRERIVANHVEPGSEMDLLDVLPRLLSVMTSLASWVKRRAPGTSVLPPRATMTG